MSGIAAHRIGENMQNITVLRVASCQLEGKTMIAIHATAATKEQEAQILDMHVLHAAVVITRVEVHAKHAGLKLDAKKVIPLAVTTSKHRPPN